MTDIIIQGICGRMGRALLEKIGVRDDCRVVAGVDREPGHLGEIPIFSDFDALPCRGVIIDFSSPAGAVAAAQYGASNGLPCVICSTGLSKADEAVLEAAIREGQEALADTINQNPVLKKAGVVDAGGKGYLLILDGMLAELRGEPMPETEAGESREEKADFATMAAEDITFAFDTVFIVRKAMADISLEPLRTYLNSIGDSLVIGEDDEAFKVHVHTNIPGNALNEAQKYGTLELAKIENMRTQADDLAAGKHVQSTDDLDAVEAELESVPVEETPAVAAPEKPYGFLAVCAGGGLAAVDTMNHFLLNKEVIVVGSTYWNMAYGRDAGDVLNDAEGMANMRNLGQNMAFVLKKIR